MKMKSKDLIKKSLTWTLAQEVMSNDTKMIKLLKNKEILE